MKARLLLLLTLISGLCMAQTNARFPAQTLTVSGQTSAALPLFTTPFPSSYSVGNVTLTGTSLTTVTFSVMGSSDGVTFYALPITTVASPGSTPTLTVTATAAGIYQVNLAGITHVEFVTSGTFTATSVTLMLTASPNGGVSKTSDPAGAAANAQDNAEAFTTTALTSYAPIVASNIVSGRNTSLSFFTLYTPSAAGVYMLCGGAQVTVAGATGATLTVQSAWNSHGPVLGTSATAATTIGADTGSATNPCTTFLWSNGAIQLEVTIGGSPATPPTFTYWYVLSQL